MLTIWYLNEEGRHTMMGGIDHLHFYGKPSDVSVVGVKQTDNGLTECFVAKASELLAVYSSESKELKEVVERERESFIFAEGVE